MYKNVAINRGTEALNKQISRQRDQQETQPTIALFVVYINCSYVKSA